MAEIRDVDNWVDKISTLPIKHFYPTAVVKETGLPLNDVFTRLLLLVKAEKLQLIWEIRCPECFHVVKTIADQSSIMSETLYCDICGEEIEVSLDIVFPAFKVNPEYKKRMKSNN